VSSAPEPLRGERVVLRPAGDADLLRLQEIRAEPSVARWWVAVDPLWDEDELPWVIEVGGEAAGYLSMYEENEPDFRHVGIDLFLADRFQGRGLGPEALRLAIAHLIDDRGHHRVTIDPQAANARAVAAYEKVGFRRVGVMRQYTRDAVSREWSDALLMELLAGDLRDSQA
jgi:aminoglycoside 6'-N-acetyltransferase